MGNADVPAEREIHKLLRELAPLLGIEWRKYRRRQSRRGLLARLKALELEFDLEHYRQVLVDHPEEREQLIASMRVTVSRFYRDPAVWRALESEVVPALLVELDRRQLAGPFRVWSAGCASGEEPYSVAILWGRLDPQLTRDRPIEILATDLDPEVLERARAGVYSRATLRHLPLGELERCFDEVSPGRLRIDPALRSAIHFAQADLLEDLPPPHQHLVLCRYLAFTYFREARLERALAQLQSALEPWGALVVGEKESVPVTLAERLAPWPAAPCVYRRDRER